MKMIAAVSQWPTFKSPSFSGSDVPRDIFAIAFKTPINCLGVIGGPFVP